MTQPVQQGQPVQTDNTKVIRDNIRSIYCEFKPEFQKLATNSAQNFVRSKEGQQFISNLVRIEARNLLTDTNFFYTIQFKQAVSPLIRVEIILMIANQDLVKRVTTDISNQLIRDVRSAGEQTLNSLTSDEEISNSYTQVWK